MKRTVETTKYQFTHGKLPRGRGYWAFGNKAETKVVYLRGIYAEAKKDAIAWAATNLDETEALYVLP